MSDKKSLKYPLPGDIDLTEDEVFRNQEFHVFEPGKKLLPWQAYDSNWIDYSFGTINLSTTTSSLLNNRFSTSTTHILNDFNKLDVVSNNSNIAKIVSTYSDTAKYTVTYNFDGTSYIYTKLLPVEGELKLVDLYEKLPFSPFRDPKEIPVHIHEFKHVMKDNSEDDMEQSRLYLNFKNNGMKYSGNLNPNELFNMSGSKYVRKTLNENDEESYEIVIRNPNKELFEVDLVLSAYEPYNEIEAIDMRRFPWERERHRANDTFINIGNAINALRSTWINTEADDILVATV